MKIYEADEIWGSVEYATNDLRKKEFVESEVAHAEKRRAEKAEARVAELEECLRDVHKLICTSGVPPLYALERIEESVEVKE